MTDALAAVDAARLLSSASGEQFTLVGRLAGGETGAHEFTDGDGRRVVVKWEPGPASAAARRRAVGLTDRLRSSAGWPVPAPRTVDADECLFVIQALVPGAPIEWLTHAHLDRLFELHRSRLGLEEPEDGSRWPEPLIATLTIGGDGYCLHESLRGYDERTAALVARVERIGRELDASAFAGGDIVHWDWHPGNVLEVDGRVGAIIDNDFVTTGDAAFDLVTLAVSSLTLPCEAGVRRRLFDAGINQLDRTKREAYVGHHLVRYLDWSIRKKRAGPIEFWLNHAPRLFGA